MQDKRIKGIPPNSTDQPVSGAGGVHVAPWADVLRGPVLADLANGVAFGDLDTGATGPARAAREVSDAAQALAGQARDAGELAEWLSMCGLTAEGWHAPAGVVTS